MLPALYLSCDWLSILGWSNLSRFIGSYVHNPNKKSWGYCWRSSPQNMINRDNNMNKNIVTRVYTTTIISKYFQIERRHLQWRFREHKELPWAGKVVPPVNARRVAAAVEIIYMELPITIKIQEIRFWKYTLQVKASSQRTIMLLVSRRRLAPDLHWEARDWLTPWVATLHIPPPGTMTTVYDDVIKWKHFPRNWPFVRKFTGPRWISRTKASDAELWCFLWFTPE